jgi:hypothetical protein
MAEWRERLRGLLTVTGGGDAALRSERAWRAVL